MTAARILGRKKTGAVTIQSDATVAQAVEILAENNIGALVVSDDGVTVAGILSAMDSNSEVSWLVMACDLPNVDTATIRYLLKHNSPDHHATCYRSSHDDLPEPLCAIYRPASRTVLDSFVADGIVCPRKMLINSTTHLLNQPNPVALHNINSPEDLVGTGVKIA